MRSGSAAKAIAIGIAAVLAGGVGVALAQTEDHPYTAAEILAGSALYARNCQLCHGTNGDGIGGVNLARQQFKKAVSDDDIRATIHGGVTGAGMPAFAALTPDNLDSLVAFIRSGFDRSDKPMPVGDKARGLQVFQGKGGCSACHLPEGDGPYNAPSLSGVASERIPADILRMILDPNKAMYPIDRPVRIVTRDGRTIRGRRLNEDTYSVQLIDEHHQLVSLAKADIRTFDISPTSAMPAYAGKLTDAELSDLMAYLESLKGL
ncbi:MAG TPA: c-type cytochrome [Caulobacteraceae bacterium]|nr:c-type cytochrome [Caulobacteraceae bacterium]